MSSLILSDDERLLIKNAFRFKEVEKRQYLLQEGDTCKYMAFILKGSGKMYATNTRGQEHIIRLAIESCWIGDYESYNFRRPSYYCIQMLEDAEVLVITKDQLEELKQTVPAVGLTVNEIDRKIFVAAQKHIECTISLSANDRYKNFVKAYPRFIKRFPQTMIASYLGISMETLSRIRKGSLLK